MRGPNKVESADQNSNRNRTAVICLWNLRNRCNGCDRGSARVVEMGSMLCNADAVSACDP